MFGRVDERNFINSEEFKRYRNFAFKNDVIKLSAGVILGGSFNKVVQGISDYLIMPIASFAISKTGNEWRNVGLEPLSGLRFELGRLAGVFVDFLVVSFILYLIYVKLMGTFEDSPKEPVKPPQKQCPHCLNQIHEEAKRCPMCTGSVIVKKRGTGIKDKGTKSSGGKQKRPGGSGGKNRNSA